MPPLRRASATATGAGLVDPLAVPLCQLVLLPELARKVTAQAHRRWTKGCNGAHSQAHTQAASLFLVEQQAECIESLVPRLVRTAICRALLLRLW